MINLDINTRAGVVNWRRLIVLGCVAFWAISIFLLSKLIA
jgi:hypothetical protein